MKIRNLVYIFCIVLLQLSYTGCNKEKQLEAMGDTAVEDSVPVVTMEIIEQDFTTHGEYYGNIKGLQEATIVCYAGGNVENISVREGSRVSKGTSCAKIDSKKSIALLETAELNRKVAYDNYERLKKHLLAGNASQVAVDQAKLKWLNTKTAIIDAKKIKKGALCISPINGVITKRYIETNQELPPGTQTFTVTQLYKMKINIGIPESDIHGVKEGNNAEVTLSVLPGRVWKGKIKRLAREASNKSRSFDAEIHVDNKDRAILPGLTGHVNLVLRNLSNQIVIPTTSILVDGEERFVMIAQDNNCAEKYVVETGASNKTYTVITSGLEIGLKLIVEGQQLVSSGSLIKF